MLNLFKEIKNVVISTPWLRYVQITFLVLNSHFYYPA